MLNIALAGPICSGKTTIAQAFVNVLGYRRLAFADALKSKVAQIESITVDQLNANKARYRADLQFWGAAAREEDPLYWCHALGREIEADTDDALTNYGFAPAYVIDDLRYHNEATYLRERGFVIVAVHTPEIIRRRRHYDRYRADLPLDDDSETQSKVIAADVGISGVSAPLVAVAEIIRWYGRHVNA